MAAWYRRLLWSATALALFVVVLGAAVRLNDAGLGCPDWPGCYGVLIPTDIDNQTAIEEFPERPVEVGKAWYEMVHRYVATTLGFLIVLITWCAWRNHHAPGQPFKTPLVLLGVVIFQGLLGMWTVTLKLKPIIVMAHLLGGLTSFSLILWLMFSSRRPMTDKPNIQIRRMRPAIITALFILALQIALGGWTSANYAALACPDVPMCTGQWWPDADFKEGFILWREVGVDYEGGLLDHRSRIAIHLTHRIGAVVTLFVLIALAIRSLKIPRLRTGGQVLMVLVVGQFMLGVLNVALYLPLANAVAHNAGAVLLLATLLGLLNKTTTRTY